MNTPSNKLEFNTHPNLKKVQEFYVQVGGEGKELLTVIRMLYPQLVARIFRRTEPAVNNPLNFTLNEYFYTVEVIPVYHELDATTIVDLMDYCKLMVERSFLMSRDEFMARCNIKSKQHWFILTKGAPHRGKFLRPKLYLGTHFDSQGRLNELAVAAVREVQKGRTVTIESWEEQNKE